MFWNVDDKYAVYKQWTTSFVHTQGSASELIDWKRYRLVFANSKQIRLVFFSQLNNALIVPKGDVLKHIVQTISPQHEQFIVSNIF